MHRRQLFVRGKLGLRPRTSFGKNMIRARYKSVVTIHPGNLVGSIACGFAHAGRCARPLAVSLPSLFLKPFLYKHLVRMAHVRWFIFKKVKILLV